MRDVRDTDYNRLERRVSRSEADGKDRRGKA
jgi:hypothetical protein